MEIRQLISEYYGCWVGNDRAGARALLADDLVFRSPMHDFDGADEFMNCCWQYAAGFSSFEPVQEAYGGNTAYVAYGVGDIKVGEFIRMRDGLISEIWVTFRVTA